MSGSPEVAEIAGQAFNEITSLINHVSSQVGEISDEIEQIATTEEQSASVEEIASYNCPERPDECGYNSSDNHFEFINFACAIVDSPTGVLPMTV